MIWLYEISLVGLVTGWGGDGHAVVVQLAIELISEKGSKFINALVSDDIIEASRWADSSEASDRYPDSHDYHFSHTPYRDCQEFDMDRDCGFPGKEGLCIVAGLAESIYMVSDPEIARENRTDALKFILHLMADIHQPLHTGFREDAGGTGIDVTNVPNTTLHTMWDYGLIESHLGDKSWRTLSDSIYKSINSNDRKFYQRISVQQNLTAILSNGTMQALVDYVATIASETSMSSTCKFAYTNELGEYIESGQFLSEDYMRRGKVGVQIQLSKAAVRLALLIDAIAEVYSSRWAERREHGRALRIEKLFEESRKRAAENSKRIRDPLASNYFAVLAIDFDEEQYLYDSQDDLVVPLTTSTGLSKKQRKAMREARKAAEELRLKRKTRRDEKRRRARLIHGIDLNALVLIKREGRYIVTIEKFVTNRVPNPYLTIHVRFGNRGSEAVEFLLDSKVFGDIPSQDFVTKMFTALGNVDDHQVTDAATIVETKYPVAKLGYGSELDAMVAAAMANRTEKMRAACSTERFDTMEDRIRVSEKRDQMYIERLKRFEKDIIAIKLSTRTTFISTYSLCKDPKKTVFTFNQFGRISPSDPTGGVFLIDTNLFDETLTHGVYTYVRHIYMSQPGRDRAKRLRADNVTFMNNFIRLIEAIGFGKSPMNPVEIAAFKSFTVVEREDKPVLKTFRIDFSPNPDEEEMVQEIIKMRASS